MATYIILINYTEQGIKSIKDITERTEGFNKAVEAAGGRVIEHYMVMGQYDRVTIIELPNDDIALNVLLRVGVSGVARTTTLKAWPAAEFTRIVDSLPSSPK